MRFGSCGPRDRGSDMSDLGLAESDVYEMQHREYILVANSYITHVKIYIFIIRQIRMLFFFFKNASE